MQSSFNFLLSIVLLTKSGLLFLDKTLNSTCIVADAPDGGAGGVTWPSLPRLRDFRGVEVVSPRKPFKASVDRFFFNCWNKY